MCLQALGVGYSQDPDFYDCLISDTTETDPNAQGRPCGDGSTLEFVSDPWTSDAPECMKFNPGTISLTKTEFIVLTGYVIGSPEFSLYQGHIGYTFEPGLEGESLRPDDLSNLFFSNWGAATLLSYDLTVFHALNDTTGEGRMIHGIKASALRLNSNLFPGEFFFQIVLQPEAMDLHEVFEYSSVTFFSLVASLGGFLSLASGAMAFLFHAIYVPPKKYRLHNLDEETKSNVALKHARSFGSIGSNSSQESNQSISPVHEGAGYTPYSATRSQPISQVLSPPDQAYRRSPSNGYNGERPPGSIPDLTSPVMSPPASTVETPMVHGSDVNVEVGSGSVQGSHPPSYGQHMANAPPTEPERSNNVWYERWSEARGRSYYINMETKESVWTLPAGATLAEDG